MEIYAEISRKLQNKLDSGGELLLPKGISFRRKVGSRALHIECDDDMLEEVGDILDSQGISFQAEDKEKDEEAANRGGRY